MNNLTVYSGALSQRRDVHFDIKLYTGLPAASFSDLDTDTKILLGKKIRSKTESYNSFSYSDIQTNFFRDIKSLISG